MAPTKAPKLASLDKMRNRKATSSKRKRTVSDRAQPSESFEDFIFDPISMYAPLPEEDEGSDDDDEFRQGVDKKGKRRHVDCKSDVQLQGLIDSGQVDSTGSSQEEEVDSGSNSDHEEVDYQNHDYHEEMDIPNNQLPSGRDESNSNSEDEKEISSENDTPAEYLEIHKPLVVVHDDRTYFGDRGIARGGGKRTQPAVDADSDTTLKLRPGAIARQAESYAAAQLTGRERRNYLNHWYGGLCSQPYL